MMSVLALGDFFDPGRPVLGWETTNPLAYFNLGAFVVTILLTKLLAKRREESGLASGAWAASFVLCVGSGLHFVGDIFGVAEDWDHQFIHLVLLIAVVVLLVKARAD